MPSKPKKTKETPWSSLLYNKPPRISQRKVRSLPTCYVFDVLWQLPFPFSSPNFRSLSLKHQKRSVLPRLEIYGRFWEEETTKTSWTLTLCSWISLAFSLLKPRSSSSLSLLEKFVLIEMSKEKSLWSYDEVCESSCGSHMSNDQITLTTFSFSLTSSSSFLLVSSSTFLAEMLASSWPQILLSKCQELMV